MARTFGVELEVHLPRNGSYDGVADVLNAAGVACAGGRSRRGADSTTWKAVHDGSLRLGAFGSVEVVSPILSGADGFEQVRKVAEALKAYGCTVNVDCGFHCHVGVAGFTVEELKKVCLNYIWFEDFFDHVMPKDRRANTGGYAQSNRARHSGSYGTEALNRWFPRLAPIVSQHGLIEAVCGHSRYWKLNLHSLSHRPTVEFRQHAGTVEADQIVQWAKLLIAFVEKSRVSKPRPRTVTRDLSPVEEMNRFFAYIPCEPETRAFWMARRKAFATVEKTEERESARLIANSDRIAREMIATLSARRDRVLGFNRPHVRDAQRMANAIHSLNAGLAGTLPFGTANRGEYLARRIRDTREAFPALFPAATVAMAA